MSCRFIISVAIVIDNMAYPRNSSARVDKTPVDWIENLFVNNQTVLSKRKTKNTTVAEDMKGKETQRYSKVKASLAKCKVLFLPKEAIHSQQ